MKERINNAWAGLPEPWRHHIVSAVHTFVSTFITELMAMLVTTTDFSVSRFMLIAAMNAAIRAVVKSSTASSSPEVKK